MWAAFSLGLIMPRKGYKQSPGHIASYVKARMANNPLRGDIKLKSGRDRAQRAYPSLGKCGRCDNPARHRHHKDRNTLNNRTENIEFLCYKCHSLEHRNDPINQKRLPGKIRCYQSKHFIEGKTIHQWAEILGIKLCTAWRRFYAGTLKNYIDSHRSHENRQKT